MKQNPQKSITYKSFELLYKEIALPLMKFIVKRLGGNQYVAEEIFSETIFAAYKGWHTFKHKSTYFTWICKIALFKIADYYRKQIHERSVIVAPLLEEIAVSNFDKLSIEEKIVLRELQEDVKKCLSLLPEEKRRLLYLRYYKELSIKKIAEIFGTSERSIEGKIYRAKLNLKQVIYSQKEFLYLGNE